MYKMDEATVWKIIESHYADNPQSLVRHHVESYNDFYKNDIYKIIKEKNPITLVSRLDERTGEYKSKCNLYIGGKNGDKLYFAKPVIYDNDPHYMFPNEARLRNMTYAMTIHYDMDIEIIDELDENEEPRPVDTEMGEDTVDPNPPKKRFINFKKGGNALADRDLNPEIDDGKDYIEKEEVGGTTFGGTTFGGAKTTVNEMTRRKEAVEQSVNRQHTQTRNYTLEKQFLGRFPIMTQSDFCILGGMPREARFNVGECRNDPGGYFIIDGKEKTVVPQEKFGDNILRVGKANNEKILFTAEIKSVSENTSKPIRSLSVDLLAPSNQYTNMNIVVNIPNVRKPVPLFILFRALGVITDKDIVSMCLLDLNKYENLMDFFIPSVHDAGMINTQMLALQFIAELTKTKTVDNVLHILSDYFLPHIGETNFVQKAYFLGYMTFKLVSAYNGMEPPIDRDSFRYKRIELVGTLLYQLFREYYKIQTKRIYVDFEKIMYRNKGLYENDMMGLILTNYKTVLKERDLEAGFKKAFKGNWGAHQHSKKVGVVQDLNRLSFNSALSHLRKTNLPMDTGSKLVAPRVLNGSQWGIFDPIDTPDGGNIGLHKHLSMFAYITRSISREPMIKWMREELNMKMVEECGHANLSSMTKVIINGFWAGSVVDAFVAVSKVKFFRRNGLIPQYISISFDIRQNTIFIFTDGGRVCRPVFYYDDLIKKMSYETDLLNEEFKWNELLSGFNKKRPEFKDKINYDKFYKLHEVYDGVSAETNPLKIQRFIDKKGIIDYLDVNEEELALIRMKPTKQIEASSSASASATDLTQASAYTHCEIHESLIFGMMCNQIIFPQHNPAVRNSFSCGQSKQAISMYHTNYSMRMDKTALILNQGQKPLVKSRYMEFINGEENYYGENVIVAIMCYTGYNVEDAILVNEGALKRGLFRTTYFSVYETHEEKDKTSGEIVEKKILNIEKSPKNVIGTKMGYDYSKLDNFGLVQEGTEINDQTVIIGCAVSKTGDEFAVDQSKTTKKGQLGIVDKAFMTESEEGTRIAKVRIREERIPAIGDKMASRSGQKGTIGQVIPECDMPFTKDGIRPDLIVNPHAMPSRMTIGQLIECVVGKACLFQGFHGDCTAFASDGTQIGAFGKMLVKSGYHSSGNELLYNGMTGEQIESEIFFGPNYYMRLKHMVKDKVNFRAQGPRTQLTRQPVGGRANDGGLRIGEMERDSIISHGAVAFLQDAMLTRGDVFHMAVCNKTGAIAVYNPQSNLFMSPMADGPLKFVDSLDGKSMNVEHITKYGRSFSIVKVPYVFKLLMQELQAINVKMSIITEDNINQFDNMNFSKNISLLTHGYAVEPFEVINMTDRALKNMPEKKRRQEDEVPGQDKKIIEEKLVVVSEPIPDYVYEEPGFYELKPGRGYIENPDFYELKPTRLHIEKPNYMEGGKSDIIQDALKIGDEVLFNGDNLRERIWKITNINGNFSTILTDNNANLESLEDMIRVVQTGDLKKIADLYPLAQDIFNPIFNPGMMGGALPNGALPNGASQMIGAPIGALPMNQSHMIGALPIGGSPQMYGGAPHPININLVNGNNNKTTEPAIQAGGQGEDVFSRPMVRSAGNSNSNSNSNTNVEKSVSFQDSAEQSNSLDSLGNGKVNFIVKKI